MRTSSRSSRKRPASIFEISSKPSISPDRCSALRRTTLTARCAAAGWPVPLQHAGVTENGVERRAQFVAQADEIAALGHVGGFRHLLGSLQLGVGALVRVDFLHQQVGLALCFLLGHAPALVRQHEQPGRDADDDGQDDEHDPQRRLSTTLLTGSSHDTWK